MRYVSIIFALSALLLFSCEEDGIAPGYPTDLGVNEFFTFGYIDWYSNYDSLKVMKLNDVGSFYTTDTLLMSKEKWFSVGEHNCCLHVNRQLKNTTNGLYWTSDLIDQPIKFFPNELVVGKTWENSTIAPGWAESEIMINYEVVDHLPQVVLNGYTYQDVHVIAESSFIPYRDYTIYYWVGRDQGIVQVVVPAYANNMYLPTIFTRLPTNREWQDDHQLNVGITYDQAISRQKVYFNIGDRHVLLKEFKTDPWPFHGTIVPTDNIEFDSSSSYPVSRAIYAAIPRDKSPNSHIETVGLEFNTVFDKSDIDMENNRLLSNATFKRKFLKAGKQEITNSNFGFHQTYLIGQGQPGQSQLEVTQVDVILDRDNAILVSGTFEGSIGQEYIGEITNGNFQVILEN